MKFGWRRQHLDLRQKGHEYVLARARARVCVCVCVCSRQVCLKRIGCKANEENEEEEKGGGGGGGGGGTKPHALGVALYLCPLPKYPGAGYQLCYGFTDLCIETTRTEVPRTDHTWARR